MIRHLALVLLCAGCTTTRTFDVTWSFTHTGACKGPGVDPTYASQPEITLRYVNAPGPTCTFAGHVASGYENAPNPTPWD